MMNMIVDERRQKAMSQADGMKIAREVKIDVLHRNNLRIASASSSSFHAKTWTQRRFAQTNHRFLPHPVEGIPQANRRGSFPFTRGRRSDGCD